MCYRKIIAPQEGSTPTILNMVDFILLITASIISVWKGFARETNEISFATDVSDLLKEKIRELFVHSDKHSAATMLQSLINHFPHPRDHPTEIQV